MVVVASCVVMVALDCPDALIDDGLTRQFGMSVTADAGIDGVTVQPSVTGPTKPDPVTIEICADDDPPGATAGGDRFGTTVIVKSTAEARGSATMHAATRHNAATGPRPIHNFTLDSLQTDLNMSSIRFQYPSIPGITKKLPAPRSLTPQRAESTQNAEVGCGIALNSTPEAAAMRKHHSPSPPLPTNLPYYHPATIAPEAFQKQVVVQFEFHRASGLADHVWSMEELVRLLVP